MSDDMNAPMEPTEEKKNNTPLIIAIVVAAVQRAARAGPRLARPPVAEDFHKTKRAAALAALLDPGQITIPG